LFSSLPCREKKLETASYAQDPRLQMDMATIKEQRAKQQANLAYVVEMFSRHITSPVQLIELLEVY